MPLTYRDLTSIARPSRLPVAAEGVLTPSSSVSSFLELRGAVGILAQVSDHWDAVNLRPPPGLPRFQVDDAWVHSPCYVNRKILGVGWWCWWGC